jgi:hypothetical protein
MDIGQIFSIVGRQSCAFSVLPDRDTTSKRPSMIADRLSDCIWLCLQAFDSATEAFLLKFASQGHMD